MCVCVIQLFVSSCGSVESHGYGEYGCVLKFRTLVKFQEETNREPTMFTGPLVPHCWNLPVGCHEGNLEDV